MSKKIIAVNAGPRKGFNTDTLINEAIKGAESKGAEVVKFDLFRLKQYTGCISCFGCKKEKNKGHCICRDGLTPVLDAIREADGLIIGSPNYLSEMTASFRALYERLIFQNLTYNTETPCCNRETVPVLQAQGKVEITGLVVSVDRQERGTGAVSALTQIEEEYGMKTAAIVTMQEVTDYLYGRSFDGRVLIDDEIMARINAYYEQYGVKQQ